MHTLLALPALTWVMVSAIRMRSKILSRTLPVPDKLSTSAGTASYFPTESGFDNIIYSARPIPSLLSTLLTFLPDICSYLNVVGLCRFLPRYPQQISFRSHKLPLSDGTSLSFLFARHHASATRPVIIFVPGLFMTSYHSFMVELAARAFDKWAFDVVIPSLRGFDETVAIDTRPLSGSVKEADDIHELIVFLRRKAHAPKVCLLGLSFGGGIALMASTRCFSNDLSSVVAISPVIDFPKALGDCDAWPRQPWKRRGYLAFYHELWRFYITKRQMVHLSGIQDYLSSVALPYYQMTPSDYTKRIDQWRHTLGNEVRALIIHPRDDPVLSWRESAEFCAARKAAGAQVQGVFPPQGGHCANWLTTPEYTDQVILRFIR